MLAQTKKNVNSFGLFGPIFKKTFLFIFLAELISFFAYLLPVYNKISFFVIAVLITMITIKEWPLKKPPKLPA